MSESLVHRIVPPIDGPSTEWEKQIEESILNFSQIVAEVVRRIQRVNIKCVTADLTITNNSGLNGLINMIIVDATSGNVIIDFAPAKLLDTVIFTVIKEDASANTVTLRAATGEVIKGQGSGGANTVVIADRSTSFSITSDGTHLHIW